MARRRLCWPPVGGPLTPEGRPRRMRRDTLSTGRWWLTGLGLSVLFPVAAAAWASAADRSARVRAPETRAHRKQPKGLAVRIVYDNYPFDKKLQTAWGFACVVTGLEKAILFDTGGDGRILLANMRACGMEPGEIDAVVLSHIHGDHTGGLGAFLEANSRVTVYVPKVFPEGVKRESPQDGRERCRNRRASWTVASPSRSCI